MTFQNKLDFCIIHHNHDGQNKIVVFLTARGLDYIDETITMSDEYRKVKKILEDIGIFEIEFCSFESDANVDDEELIFKLEERGVRYSKSLEIKIDKEFNDMKDQYTNNTFQTESLFKSSDTYDDISDFNLSNIKIPKIGERISLFFYLFLECHFISEEDCVLALNGEFNTKENNNFRNFLKITNSDFTRIESNIPNVIVLQSTKTYKDFSDEVDILQSGNFKTITEFTTEIGQKGQKTKEFQYSFVEIKKNINPAHHIVIQVSIDGYFKQMLDKSKSIKKDLTKVKKQKISLDFIKSEINTIKNKLEVKMIGSAELDQYERAAYFKNNINILEDKLKIINDISDKKITLDEYMKIFSLV